MLVAGIVNVILAVLLAPSLKHVGVAIGSLTTEVIIFAAVTIALWRNGLSPFATPDKDVDNPQAVP